MLSLYLLFTSHPFVNVIIFALIHLCKNEEVCFVHILQAKPWVQVLHTSTTISKKAVHEVQVEQSACWELLNKIYYILSNVHVWLFCKGHYEKIACLALLRIDQVFSNCAAKYHFYQVNKKINKTKLNKITKVNSIDQMFSNCVQPSTTLIK